MNNRTAELLSEIIFYSTIVTVIGLTVYFWPNFTYIFLVWILAGPVALLTAFISGIILSMFSEKMQEEDEEDEFEDETKAFIVEQEQLILSKSEVILGTFKNEPIHEWIEIANPETQQPLKLWFDGTFNADSADNFAPPEDMWWALIQPGILYVEKDSPK